MLRRSVLPGGAGLLLAPGLAGAQTWPVRPVRIIVPFLQGSTIDVMGRLLASRLSESFGQPFVVENRIGAGSTIGTEAAARSGDQHTLLMVSMAYAVTFSMYQNLHYRPEDLVAVAPISIVPNVVLVPSNSPIRDIKSLIEAARQAPGRLTYASSGNGSSVHLAGALFASVAGINITHVPYRGSTQGLADLISNRVDMMFDSIGSSGPHIASGALRVLASTSTRRSRSLPDVSTVVEAGLPGYTVDPWFAMLAPRDLPDANRRRVEAEILRTLQQSESWEKLSAIGAEPMPGDAASLEAFIRVEITKWRGIATEIGLRAD